MMQVDLVWITPEAERIISHIARVSNPKNQDNPNYAKLIRYLIENKHWSPLEMASACFSIKTSRAIAQQILRHRSFSFQEFSQRYSAATEIEPVELRKQALKNRQSSEEVFDPILMTVPFYNETYDVAASTSIKDHFENSLELYQELIDAGVAKECARMVLPLATQTHLYMSGTIRSWIHYLALRNDEHTQKEHQLVAQEIEKILRLYLPTIFEALDAIKQEETNNRLLLQLLIDNNYTDLDTLKMQLF